MHKIDKKDLSHVIRLGYKPIAALPCPINKNGKINPHVTSFLLSDKITVASVFHIKPIYYETIAGFWRPMSEICEYHGNRKIVLNKNWRLAHPRFIDWLSKRQSILGQELLLPTPFGDFSAKYHNIARPNVSIGLTVSTVYPDANPETTTVDGRPSYQGGVSWDTAHDAATGTATDDSNTQYANGCRQRSGMGYDIFRGVYYFDTSVIPATDVISNAVFSLYIPVSPANDDNDGDDFLGVVQVQGDNVSSNTSVATTDYGLIGDAVNNPTEAHDNGDRIDISSVGSGGYIDWPFNATGIGWIARNGEASPAGATNGITYLGVREGHDILDNPIANSTQNWIQPSYADQSGTDQDPKLVATHEVGDANQNSNFLSLL